MNTTFAIQVGPSFSFLSLSHLSVPSKLRPTVLSRHSLLPLLSFVMHPLVSISHLPPLFVPFSPLLLRRVR
jgi:hypothetical protein